jgi:hypothetical protein
VAADGRGREPESLAETDRRLGPVLVQRPDDAVAGARVIGRLKRAN